MLGFIYLLQLVYKIISLIEPVKSRKPGKYLHFLRAKCFFKYFLLNGYKQFRTANLLLFFHCYK